MSSKIFELLDNGNDQPYINFRIALLFCLLSLFLIKFLTFFPQL